MKELLGRDGVGLGRDEVVVGKEWLEEDVAVEEWTDPPDGQKEIFFRNLFSVVSEPAYRDTWVGGWMRWWQVQVVMWEGDNFEVPGFLMGWGGGAGGGVMRGWVEGWVVKGLVGGWAGGLWVLGRGMGFKGVEEAWTPGYLIMGKGRKGE